MAYYLTLSSIIYYLTCQYADVMSRIPEVIRIYALFNTYAYYACVRLVKAIENPSAPGGFEIKITPEDPSCRSIRLVTEMMVLVGEGMGM